MYFLIFGLAIVSIAVVLWASAYVVDYLWPLSDDPKVGPTDVGSSLFGKPDAAALRYVVSKIVQAVCAYLVATAFLL